MQIVETGAALQNRFGGVHPGARRVAYVYAQADPFVERLDGLPNVKGRREAFILRPVIMDGEFDVELLDETLQKREGIRVRAAHNRREPCVPRVLEGLAHARLVVFQSDVAAAK